MLWRASQSSPRLADGLLPRVSYPSTVILRTRIRIQSPCIRSIHIWKTVDTEYEPPLVRHERLLEGPLMRHESPLEGPQMAGKLQLVKTIKVTGLVRSIRKQKNIAFARIGDGSTLANIQAVFPDPQLAKEYVKSDLKVF